MQSRPESVVGPVGVNGDGVRPLECGALAARESLGLARVGFVRQEAEAQLLQGLIGDSGPEDARFDLRPRIASRGLKRADLVTGGTGESRHQRAAPAARPAPGSPGSSLWPTCQVLMTRCCPKVTAMNEPSSTICASLKCSRSLAHTASSAPSGSQ